MSNYFPGVLLRALQLFLRSKGLLNYGITFKSLRNEFLRIALS